MTVFLETPQLASRWCQQQRQRGLSIGYVATMGALHAGHLSLVHRSVSENDRTCVSIFINPLQFNNPDDIEKYPRLMEDDIAMLAPVGCNMVYTGSLQTFFPEHAAAQHIATKIIRDTEGRGLPDKIIQGLEAVYRPGHLEGVKAIVERLFQTVAKCRAYFGEKDFQQTLLVQQIAAAGGQVEIVVCPTSREPSGLAMSSRNQRLSAPGKTAAAVIYQALVAARRGWLSGNHNPASLEQIMREQVCDAAVTLEYAAVRDPDNWSADTPSSELNNARALIAAYVEGVRLIDNLALTQH